ncbi:division/cell wall cluster transcriptional repressor MraZ [Rhodoflexus caldus]|uniref:division/cell wall cluster transcriptional repressor MraZ n=1 Tax=Rhodoflexus caldus TaxID=2891236 RepID=UPI00202A1F17|nr:division/cell wall cluster transcriptional repressor MraZ [Rhodoflexus caldus]
MPAFSGEYECKLDAKGRLVLPAKIKAALPPESAETIVLTRGFEPCIILYSLVHWKELSERVIALNEFVEEYRTFQRNFFRGNTEVELDSAGRFLVPRTMLKYANIEKDAIVVGAGNRVEIWQPDAYEAALVQDSKQFSQMAERVFGREGNL